MKKRLPCSSCRTNASPDGRLQSASTHIEPTGSHWPDPTFRVMPAKISGYDSLIHAYWAGCEQAKRKSGYASMRANAVENVRAHLRRASRRGHSHAVSMWAWPTALIKWDEVLGVDITSSSAAG